MGFEAEEAEELLKYLVAGFVSLLFVSLCNETLVDGVFPGLAIRFSSVGRKKNHNPKTKEIRQYSRVDGSRCVPAMLCQKLLRSPRVRLRHRNKLGGSILLL